MAKEGKHTKTPIVVSGNTLKTVPAYILERPPPDHPVYTVIGQLASEWAHLEHALDMPIRRLAGIDDSHLACLTAQYMGVTPRFNAIIALLTVRAKRDVRFSETMERANSLLRKSYDLSERRNRAIHDPWYLASSLDGVGIAQFMKMPRKDLYYGIRRSDHRELKKIVADIGSFTDEVRKFDRFVIVALEASRRRPPQEPP
jgi:hypothetical protein